MPGPKRRAGDWIAVAEALLLLGLARLAIVALPAHRLQRGFGRLGTPLAAPPELDTQSHETLQMVRWAVHGVAARTPWTSNCLPQALAAKYMLARRGLLSTLYVGAAFSGRDALKAHAWLRCGDVPVTGGRNNEQWFGAIVAYT